MQIRNIFMVIIVSAILLSVMAALTPITRADTEPNNDFAHAELITTGTHTGTLNDTDTYDYYKITVGAGQTLNVSVTPDSNLAIYLTLWSSTTSSVAYDVEAAGIPVTAEWTTNSAKATYTYYIELENDNGGTGNYTMQVALISQNDGGSGKDAGDTIGTATSISSANATYAGFMKDDDYYDYYKLTVTAGQTLAVNATPADTMSLYLTLYNPSGGGVAYDGEAAGVMVVANWTTNSAQATYTYTIGLEDMNGYGSYSFRVTLVSQNDANSGGDAGDALAKATPIASANATYSGFLKDDDVYDYYKLSILAGQTLSVKATPVNTLGINLDLYNPSLSDVAWNQTLVAGFPVSASWTTNSAAANYTYYVRVSESTGYGTYSMTISIHSQNDANSKGDAGDTLATATALNFGTYSGFMKDDDKIDWYKTVQNVTAGQGIYVKVTPSIAQAVKVSLYDAGQTLQKSNSSSTAGFAATVGARAAKTEIFYIRIDSLSGYGNYTVAISAEPTLGVPTRTPQTPNAGQAVKVSVSVSAPLKSVSSVILSYNTTTTAWTNVSMSLNATSGLYQGTIPGLSAGTKVYYKLTAYTTAGDYFVLDNAGQYYVYNVVPEFPILITALALFCALTLAMVIFKRRIPHQSKSLNQTR
jgi:hypothetical protein